MKHLSLVIGLVISSSLPLWAQPIGGPIELHNPHRRNGIGSQSAGSSVGAVSETPATGVPDASVGAASATALAPLHPAPPPTVAMFADGCYLFVLRGDTLFQFDKKTLELLNSTELPRFAVSTPAPSRPEEGLRTQTSPPLRPGARFKVGP